MTLSDWEKAKLNELFIKQFGSPLKHFHFSNNLWNVAVWDQASVSHLEESKHLNNELDKLWAEMANTDRNTISAPILAEMGLPSGAHLLTAQQRLDNILTNVGMTDMAENRTNESSLHTSHVAVGSDNTAETVTDTALGTEEDRKAWSELVTVDQTERYAGSFVRSDFGSDVTLREAGGFTAASGPICVFRVTFADKPISTGQIMTVQVSVQHQNGVVV